MHSHPKYFKALQNLFALLMCICFLESETRTLGFKELVMCISVKRMKRNMLYSYIYILKP